MDHLLGFDDEAAAIASLPSLRDGEDWSSDALPVVLVTAEPVYSAPDDDGNRFVVVDRVIQSGFWLLTTEAGLPGVVAAIERATGVIMDGDQTLAGARLDPVWAGAEDRLQPGATVFEPEPDPLPISRRQFAQQLAVMAVITEAEALAWSSRGDLPDLVTEAIGLLPPADRFPAEMLLSSAGSFEFGHALSTQFGALLGFSEADRRQIWLAAGAL